ncbi:MAG: polysaccharide deacetylase family protein [Caulobacteraceae bacterium]
MMSEPIYRPDMSLKGKLRRRFVRLQHRRPARGRLTRTMVSFAFDDAPASALTVGGAILESFGKRGTYFISAGLSGTSGHMGPYGTQAQVMAAADAGHEIACHTYSHLDCAQASGEVVAQDIARNSATLMAWGAPEPTTFAYPFGDVAPAAKAAAGQRFALSRALHRGVINTGSDLNQAPAIGIEGEGGERLGLRWLQKAHDQLGWVILFTHGVEADHTPFGATAAGFERLVGEAVARDYDIVTIAEGVRRLADPS